MYLGKVNQLNVLKDRRNLVTAAYINLTGDFAVTTGDLNRVIFLSLYIYIKLGIGVN